MAWIAALMAVGGAVIGARTSQSATRQTNKEIEKTAALNQESINKNISQARLQSAEDTAISSKKAQAALGSFRNAVGFDGGVSTSLWIAGKVADIEADQSIREQNAQALEESFELQKRQIMQGAQTQVQAPGLAALQGAVSGAQTGFAIGSSVESLASSAEQAELVADKSSLARQQTDLAVVQTQSIRQRMSFEKNLNMFYNRRLGISSSLNRSMLFSPFTSSGSNLIFPQ